MPRSLGIIPPARAGLVWRHEGPSVLGHRHRHAELELNHVVRGQGVYVVGDHRIELSPGTQIWLFPAQDHLLLDQSEDFCAWMGCWRPEAVARWCTTEATAPLRLEDPGRIHGRRLQPAAGRPLETLFAETAACTDDAVHTVASGHLLLASWLRYLEADERPSTRPLHPAVRRAAEHLGDGSNAPISEIATRCGLSTSRLGELFREQLGTTPVAFRNRHRVERFLSLYGDGRGPTMMDAALEAGFGSYAQFHRAFKHVMGRGPAAYRRDSHRH